MVALIASWAPQGQFATDTSLLAGIGACYGPQQGTLYQVVKDQVFTYAIPIGWQTASETQDSIEIDKGTDAGASYNLLAALPLDSGVNSPQTFFTWASNKLGIQVGQIVGSSSSPNQTSSTGAVTGQGIVEFIGTLKGQQIHGFAFLLTTSSPGFNTSGVLRLAFATTAMWNSLNGALIHIVGSIQHDFTQDLQEWERLSQQWQAFGQQVQGFDYALTGVDLVNDPTTGATFEAPSRRSAAAAPTARGTTPQRAPSSRSKPRNGCTMQR